jgi:hypothetical protein
MNKNNISKEVSIKSKGTKIGDLKIQSEHNKKRNYFKIASRAILLLLLPLFFVDTTLTPFYVSLLVFVLSPLLGIVAEIISYRRRQRSVVAFVAGVTWKVILIVTLGRLVSPYTYTKPAITEKKLSVYKDCVNFFARYNEYNSFEIDKWGRIWIDGSVLYTRTTEDKNKAAEIFGEKDVAVMGRLSEQLRSIDYTNARRFNNFVLFEAFGGSWQFKKGDVLYSLDGNNPNEIDKKFLNSKKPFIHLGGNWYAFENHVAKPRLGPLPKRSFIDHSLKIDGLDLEHDFVR